LKNVLVLSGGTGTAWSICSALKKIAGETIRLIVCDTNPSFLVHTSVLADIFLTVLPIADPSYYKSMLEVFDKYNIDILIPLIDWDLQMFPRDSQDLLSRNIFSTAPDRKTFQSLSNKKKLHETARSVGVPTPEIYTAETVDPTGEYVIKPIIGFGSRNVKKISGAEIQSIWLDEFIVQEMCQPVEVTVDIFHYLGQVNCVCRERIETKAGVCTKARIFRNRVIEDRIQRFASVVSLPECCCAQFMQGRYGDWLLTDFNLRLGAGSALSAAVGFGVAEAAVAVWLKKPLPILKLPNGEHFVVRYYTELVTK